MPKLTITLLHDSEPTAVSSAKALKLLLEMTFQDVLVYNICFPCKGVSIKQIRDIDQQGYMSDIIISINYLRSSFKSALKHKPYWITWVQDDLSWIPDETIREDWNNNANDWCIGYTNLLQEAGYTSDKLIQTPFFIMPTAPDLTCNDAIKEYDVVFAGNKGYKYCDYIESLPGLNDSIKILLNKYANTLWEYYQNGNKICGYRQMWVWIKSFMPVLYSYYLSISNSNDKRTFQLYLYWGINEAVYRQTALKWCVDLGVNLRIAGYNWGNNPLFNKYCLGYVDNSNIGALYNKSRYVLHLNSMESYHHRLAEILINNSRILTRGNACHEGIAGFDKNVFIKQQCNLIQYCMDKILNNNMDMHPDISMLSNLAQYSNTFSKKSELLINSRKVF